MVVAGPGVAGLGVAGLGSGQAAAQARPAVATRPTAALPAWGQARQVPGTETFSHQSGSNDGKALVGTGITSVTCPARGDCATSGGFVDEGFNFLVFTAGQHAGTWAKAAVVPGDVALVDHGGAAGSDEMISGPFLSQVACSSAGNCGLAGNYQVNDAGEETRPLLATERNGRWGQVHAVSGAQATALLTIACPRAAGDCAAGGLSETAPTGSPVSAFVVSEHGGVWGPPRPVAGSTEPITTMACPAAGSCLAAGAGYTGGEELFPAGGTAFIVTERNGKWGSSQPVPGLTRLTHGGSEVDSVSCVSAGNCTLGGGYVDSAGHAQVFVASEHGGTWGPAQRLPGLPALNQGGRAGLTQVSCGSARLCAAGGWYLNLKRKQRQQAWVATEIGGRWQRAEKVPGTTALNTGGNAAADTVSCSTNSCVAGGWYSSSPFYRSGFLVTERRGTWGTAAQVPGLARLNTGREAVVTSLSCLPSGSCTAVGDYADAKSFENRMFVVSQH